MAAIASISNVQDMDLQARIDRMKAAHPVIQLTRFANYDQVRDGLDQLRADWQEATGGDMSRVTLDLGALFDDLAELLGAAL